MLAGLPPVAGLYASTLPLIVYALLGSSRQLAVGPVCHDVSLVIAGVSPFAAPGSEKYIGLVLLLSLMVGVIQFFMGLFRAGFIVNFLVSCSDSRVYLCCRHFDLIKPVHHLFGIPSSGGTPR